MYKLNSYFCVMENIFTDEYFMKKALQEAEIAFEKGEIPVGAIIVIDNKLTTILNSIDLTIKSFISCINDNNHSLLKLPTLPPWIERSNMD